METTLGREFLKAALPKQFHNRLLEEKPITKKDIHMFFQQLAEHNPDLYEPVLQQLSSLGAEAAWSEGASVSLASLRASKRKRALLMQMQQELQEILDRDDLSDSERNDKIISILQPYIKKMQDAALDDAKEAESPFYNQIDSGARGKKSDLNSLQGADVLVTDQNDRYLPIPIIHSYADGLTPVEWFATSYGQRKGQIGVKFATSDAGFYSKRLNNAAHRFVVTHERPREYRHPVGLPVSTDDPDNVGAVLAMDIGNYKKGTILTKDILDDLVESGYEEILIYSPMTEYTEDNGISRFSAGRRVSGPGLTRIGENVGLMAAQAIGERLSQGALSSKHSAGASDRVHKSGFVYLNRLVEAPERFPEASPLVEEGGIVSAIRKAPQGGYHVVVGNRVYYVPAGQELIVSEGQEVEPGDPLSDGVPHPAHLVRLRGIGEARRIFLEHFRKALEDSGAPAHRRNVETVVAGLLNWAEVSDDPPDEQLADEVTYGDIIYANRVFAKYTPRQDARDLAPSAAVGMYLEEPVLHFTPGTRITKRVADMLNKWGIKTVLVHRAPPWFVPKFIRSIYSVYYDPDWRTRLMGFYTTRSFIDAVHRGAVSDRASTSYAPAIANPYQFGRRLSTLGKYGKYINFM